MPKLVEQIEFSSWLFTMNEVLDGQVLTLRSGYCTTDFLRKMSRFRQSGLYIDIRLEVDGDQGWHAAHNTLRPQIQTLMKPRNFNFLFRVTKHRKLANSKHWWALNLKWSLLATPMIPNVTTLQPKGLLR